MRRTQVSTDTRGHPVRTRPALRSTVAPAVVPTVVLALLTAALRLPFVGRPLSPDEGGFLMLGGQWSPGSSLYGDYWVDRPPLLIGIFEVADHLGGAVPLRVIGMVAVAIAVVLAGGIGLVGAPGRRWAPALAAGTAAVFLSTPLFGTREVNGELLALPFVLGGLLAVLVAVRADRGGLACWAAAGALTVCAMAVKQNMADAGVAGAAALAWLAWRHGVRRAAYAALAAAAGAVLAAAAVLVWAEARGTEPGALWDAVVSFRFQAAAVISDADPQTTSDRLRSMLNALVFSGAPVLFLLPFLGAPRAHQGGCLPFVAAAVALWEAIGVAGGGSYWWHYLIGLVPGLVLVVAAMARHRPGLQVPAAVLLAYSAVVGYQYARYYPGPTRTQLQNERAGAYLASHARPGDTGVVAFGIPSILQRAGMSSPYRYLWSLPVRVRDPRLVELARVLRSPDRPTWVVVSGGILATWGVDPARAQRELDRGYDLAHVEGDWYFFHVAHGHGSLSG